MNEQEDSVMMMTMHSSKGLEFPVVFLPGMEDGVFPSVRSIYEPEELEEERRLCYVAITRARKKLYISHAYERMVFGTTNRNRLSRFAAEIPEDKLEMVDTTAARREAYQARLQAKREGGPDHPRPQGDGAGRHGAQTRRRLDRLRRRQPGAAQDLRRRDRPLDPADGQGLAG